MSQKQSIGPAVPIGVAQAFLIWLLVSTRMNFPQILAIEVGEIVLALVSSLLLFSRDSVELISRLRNQLIYLALVLVLIGVLFSVFVADQATVELPALRRVLV